MREIKKTLSLAISKITLLRLLYNNAAPSSCIINGTVSRRHLVLGVHNCSNNAACAIRKNRKTSSMELYLNVVTCMGWGVRMPRLRLLAIAYKYPDEKIVQYSSYLYVFILYCTWRMSIRE